VFLFSTFLEKTAMLLTLQLANSVTLVQTPFTGWTGVATPTVSITITRAYLQTESFRSAVLPLTDALKGSGDLKQSGDPPTPSSRLLKSMLLNSSQLFGFSFFSSAAAANSGAVPIAAWVWVIAALAVLALAAGIIIVLVLCRKKPTPPPVDDVDGTTLFLRRSAYDEAKGADHTFSNPIADVDEDGEFGSDNIDLE
jgi:hypothetical protein